MLFTAKFIRVLQQHIWTYWTSNTEDRIFRLFSSVSGWKNMLILRIIRPLQKYLTPIHTITQQTNHGYFFSVLILDLASPYGEAIGFDRILFCSILFYFILLYSILPTKSCSGHNSAPFGIWGFIFGHNI